jgi:hypothetical protein
MNITPPKMRRLPRPSSTTNQPGWVRSYGLFTGTPTVPPGF